MLPENLKDLAILKGEVYALLRVAEQNTEWLNLAALPPMASQAVYFCGLDKGLIEGPAWSHLKETDWSGDVTQQRVEHPTASWRKQCLSRWNFRKEVSSSESPRDPLKCP